MLLSMRPQRVVVLIPPNVFGLIILRWITWILAIVADLYFFEISNVFVDTMIHSIARADTVT